MVAGIIASARGKDWVVNMPANRLSPDTLNGGDGALVKVYRRLVELVPERRRARLFCECLVDGKAVLEGEAWVALPPSRPKD